ncbi:hypothetical protein [Reichenbachiella versicolor]|uniref:hypothetical protein n=1 Tax=Reichenbachiella versicolor TaxID=1821036 RepID=UPI000D6DE64B|nr:hypothetical protein [Reichenbachiella versicolor]
MAIDLNLLQTVEECDNALDIITAEKTQIERRLRNLGESLESRSARTIEVTEGISDVKAIIAGYTAAMEVITEGKAKRELALKVQREEAKLQALENRQANYSSVSLIEDLVDQEQLAVQIPVLADTIVLIEQHKAEL